MSVPRNAGDRMTIKGMKGTKKVNDIFIDQKIPVAVRADWPIITDQSGEIVWLPGLRKSVLDICVNPEQPHYFLQYSEGLGGQKDE